MDRKEALGLFLAVWLTALGAFIRLKGLSDYFYSPDDLLHMYIASADWNLMFVRAKAQIHPPLGFIVFHFVWKIFGDFDAMRYVSIVCGVATIPVFYALGRRASGPFVGVCLSFLAAFGFGGLVLSQVVRSYALVVLLLAAAMIFLADYLREGKRSSLGAYAFFMLLVSGTHYCAAMPLAGFGTAILAKAVLSRKPPRDYIFIFAVHAPIAALLLASYLVHVSDIFGSGYYSNLKTVYLEGGFPSGPAGYLKNTKALFSFMYLNVVYIPAAVLFLLGLVSFARKGMGLVSLALGLTFLANLFLAMAGKYPYNGARHNIFLLPVTALAIGGGAAHIVDMAKHLIIYAGREEGLEKLGGSKFAALALAAVFMGGTAALGGYYAKHDYMRHYPGMSTFTELPIKSGEARELIDFMDGRLGEGDIVLTDLQSRLTIYYLDPGREAFLRGDVLAMNYGINTVYSSKGIWSIRSDDDVLRTFREVREEGGFQDVDRALFFTLGYNFGSVPDILEYGESSGLVLASKTGKRGYAFALSVPEILRLLEKDGRAMPPESAEN